jgi:peptidoglycan/xylan/chitin deacetylase (PgdA/CDA1 family)
MAVIAKLGPTETSTALPDPPRGHNDAFSFWKLADDWRVGLESEIELSEEAAEYYLYERYLSNANRRPPQMLKAYYRIKRLIPQSLRHRLNSLAIRLRGKSDFPRWPCESALLDFWRKWLRESMRLMGETDGWHIGFWPDGMKCSIVLTHDVETAAGMRRIETMAIMEESYGFRSAWNLPLQQYPIDWKMVDRLRGRGFEFGAHGLSHDGKLFRSECDFNRLGPILRKLADVRNLKGFRAPSTLRCGDWIEKLGFDFDSSFADSDPYEPQPGGTCSVFPFFMSDMIEMPYTMPQDHTLIHVLRRSPLPVWTAKARWIESVGGMILTLVHPDYCGVGENLKEYENLLKYLSKVSSAWRALPSEVANWWRQRDGLKLVVDGDTPVIEGPGASRAIARRLSSEPLAS